MAEVGCYCVGKINEKNLGKGFLIFENRWQTTNLFLFTISLVSKPQCLRSNFLTGNYADAPSQHRLR